MVNRKGAEDVTINIGLDLSGFKKQLNDARRALKNATANFKTTFEAWALGIMFFGQSVQRTMTNVWRATSTTFNDVMHSVEGTVTSFDMLEGSMSFLKFVTGEALEPLAMSLIPIVDSVTSWVADNQQLVAQIFKISAVMGTVMALLGAGVLAGSSFLQMWTRITGVITALKPIIGGLFAGVSLAVLGTIGAVILTVIALWKTNFAGFRDFITALWSNIKDTITGVWEGLKTAFSGIWKILIGILEGDWNKVWEGMKQTVAGAWKIIKALSLAAITGIANVVVFVVNAIITSFANALKLALSIIRSMINLANKIPGIDISTSGISGLINKIEDLKQEAQVGFVTQEQIEERITNVDVSVMLDGKEIADNVSARVLNEVVRNV